MQKIKQKDRVTRVKIKGRSLVQRKLSQSVKAWQEFNVAAT